jgi:hypothetical protein
MGWGVGMSEEKSVIVELTPTEVDVLVATIEHELQGTRPLIDLQRKLQTARGVVTTRPTEQRQDQRRG